VTQLLDVFNEVFIECNNSQEQYGDFASMHEAYGVLCEEFAELFEAIRMKQDTHGIAHDGKLKSRGQCVRAEAIQVAAVAIRIAAQAERVTR
jgi:hypothetical protein